MQKNMTKIFERIAKLYLKNTDGNFGVILSICLLPLILAIGVAIDYSQLTSDKQKAQATADSAVLAAAKQYYDSQKGRASRDAGNIFATINRESGSHNVSTKFIKEGDATMLETTVTGTTKNSF